MTVAGDVNGDGFSDLLLADSQYISVTTAGFPDYGRVYLVLGRAASTASTSLDLATADYRWVDYGLGGGVYQWEILIAMDLLTSRSRERSKEEISPVAHLFSRDHVLTFAPQISNIN